MSRKWLAALSLLAALAPTAGKADVTYTLYDGATMELSFTVANQLLTTGDGDISEPMLSVSGPQAGFFTGVKAGFAQSGPPGYQPTMHFGSFAVGVYVHVIFLSGYPFGDPSNGTPGNGAYTTSGNIAALGFDPVYANIDSATISGIPVRPSPVPEPATWALLTAGFASLAAFGLARRKSAPLSGTA
jgi:PEP-CTERM motif